MKTDNKVCNILGILTVLHTLIFSVNASSSYLEGTRAYCTGEGENVPVDNVDKSGCFTCTCRNGLVDCIPTRYCPPTNDCHMIVENHGCCRKCKGCFYKGKHYESHTEWPDPDNPCTILRCEAGVLTESEVHCHTPCPNPLPPEPGRCCRRCPDCKLNGQFASEDRDVISDDPCLQCKCTEGKMICSKKACPVLQCAPKYQTKMPGDCCPRCEGNRFKIVPPKRCLIQASIFSEGQNFNIDRCTNCTCNNETSICRRATCPILSCAPEVQEPVPRTCCMKCPEIEEFAADKCIYNGQEYEDGDSWPLGECKSCKCDQGRVSCAITKCNVTCPAGARLIKLPGECCPKCEEVDGVCMVFGDPHYKTFDGKIYSFKGNGKYQLTADCKNKTFYVKVANIGNKQLSSTSTRRVAVKYGDVRINLQHKNRVKVNGELIKLPYKKEGQVSVIKSKDNIEVTLQNGIKLLWNGKSFLEVTVPATYKNKLCGLCGNFNGNVQDDLKTKSGRIVKDSEINTFGMTWCVGHKHECEKKIKPNKTCFNKRLAKNKCSLLKGKKFESCHSKLNFNKYFEACTADTCSCNDNKCYCESFMAYTRECERLGASLPNWQKHSGCDARGLARSSSKSQKKNFRRKSNKSLSLEQQQYYKLLSLPFNKTRRMNSPIPIV